jgi:hypothetical protein
MAIAGLLVLLVLGGAGTAIAIKVHHDHLVAARQHLQAETAARAAAARAAAARAAARARQQHAAQQAAEVTMREGLETSLEQSITKAAQTEVNEGSLTGPILSTSCIPLSGGSSQDLSQSTGTYTCLAVNQNNPDGTNTGYDYTGTINFNNGNYTWQLGANQ